MDGPPRVRRDESQIHRLAAGGGAPAAAVRRRLRPVPAQLPLARVDVLRRLGGADLARLERLLPTIAWLATTPMPADLLIDDHLFILREGRLALLGTAATGHSIMIALLDRGSVLSTLGGAEPPEVIALEDAVISAVPAATLRALAARYPQLGLDVAEALSDRVAMLREVTAALGQIRVDDRLWARLIQLAERVGVTTPAGVDLRLKLTHTQWARLIGCSRESVTLAFGKLRRKGRSRSPGGRSRSCGGRFASRKWTSRDGIRSCSWGYRAVARPLGVKCWRRLDG